VAEHIFHFQSFISHFPFNGLQGARLLNKWKMINGKWTMENSVVYGYDGWPIPIVLNWDGSDRTGISTHAARTAEKPESVSIRADRGVRIPMVHV
jgi:hypothetical protein